MGFKTIDDVDFKGKRVLMRVDFNVPLTEDGSVGDDYRILMALPSIRKIISDGGRLILISHLGRPKGERIPYMSLRPVAQRLSELLGQTVFFADDCIGEEVERKVNQLKDGEVLLLENLRFHKAETKNDPEFSKKLAALADIYVNDAFGTSHRAHASTVGVAEHFSLRVAGYLLEKEYRYLSETIKNPEKPFIAILGGAKISGKIDVIENLMTKVDKLLIGGGMVFTFLKAKGLEIGKSLLEEDKIDLARELIQKLDAAGISLLLPVDCVVVDNLDDTSPVSVKVEEIPADKMGIDIGPASVELFTEVIRDGKTILWNGPMGVFERSLYAEGTRKVAEAIAEATEAGAISIIGGGDSAAAIRKFGLLEKVTHVSTGGGASLEMIAGIELPAFQVLSKK